MEEKFKSYPLDHPLTQESRARIDLFITRNASRLRRPFSHRWKDPANVLQLASAPVQWTLTFHPDRLEVAGSAPLWIRMLFKEKVRATVDRVIVQMLEESGLIVTRTSRTSS